MPYRDDAPPEADPSAPPSPRKKKLWRLLWLQAALFIAHIVVCLTLPRFAWASIPVMILAQTLIRRAEQKAWLDALPRLS